MNLFDSYRQVLQETQPVGVRGRVTGVRGLTATVSDFPAPIGAACRIGRTGRCVEARVVGFAHDHTLVMPLAGMTGICKGDPVQFTSGQHGLGVGPRLLGRMINGLGQPIDGLGPIATERQTPIWPAPIPPMQRRRILQPLATGVRAIDSLLTVGRGQRMGIFSASGVGKSVLLGMIARHSCADVNVIGLIGERGREVRDFVERDLGPAGLSRSVIVVATGDEPPLLRVQAAAVATAVAEYFRDEGKHVLLLMDSLSRLAAAQRLVGLSAGEPPATKGFTPSVFNLLPQILERGGCTAEGSITGFYTVLLEEGDLAEPVSDAVRSVSDGHIYLSADLANQGHYPAIDILRSISRVMSDVAEAPHQAAARQVHRLLASFAQIQDLVAIGAYKAGASAEYDLAIAVMPAIRRFLAQGRDDASSLPQTLAALNDLHQHIQAMSLTIQPRTRASATQGHRA